ncbi:MAG: hypothetical protein J6K74_08140 [Marinifilaceae bacterium]|nr:hypothetical protein [Marinifilaceae bacterium]
MKQIALFITVFFIATISLSAQNNNTGEWHKVESGEGVTFTMPGEVSKEVSIQDGVPTYIFKSRDLNCIFGVVCSNFSDKPEMLKPEYHGSLVEILKSGSIPKEEYGKLAAEKLVQKESPLIYEINYTTEKNKIQWSYIKRFIITNSHIYQFTIGAKTRNTDQLKFEAMLFFDSIELKESNEKEAA